MSHILTLLLNLLLMMPFQPVFTAEPIPPQVEARMRGNSYPEGGAPCFSIPLTRSATAFAYGS